MGELGERSEERLELPPNPRGLDASGRTNDDVRAVAGGRGEAIAEEIDEFLGFRPGEAEATSVLAPGCGEQDAADEQECERPRDDAAWVPAREAGPAIEKQLRSGGVLAPSPSPR